MNTFKDWMRQTEIDLISIKKRLLFLVEVEKQFSKMSKNEMFNVSNGIAYRLLSDCYEMLIIDVASLCTGLLQPGARSLNQINNELGKLQYHKIKTRNNNNDYFEMAEIVLQSKQEAFRNLFPDAAEGKARQEDVNKLKERLRRISKSAIDIRNNVHAHRFEVNNKKSEGRFLKLPEISVIFKELEETLQNLRLLILDSSFDYSSLNEQVFKQTSEDMVDIVLHGTIANILEKMGILVQSKKSPRGYYWQIRKSFYESPEWETERDEWEFEKP